MNLLCHRGWWKTSENKNSLESLMFAINNDLGVETDIRDYAGELVISHDMPLTGHKLTLEQFLKNYASSQYKPLLALNIKADGLHEKLLEVLNKHNVLNYFVFDMSFPDSLQYGRLGMHSAARVSEYEPLQSREIPICPKYIWVDSFAEEWFSTDYILDITSRGKVACIVSPELHKRQHIKQWEKLLPLVSDSRVYLCTDLITEALEFFDAGKN